MEIKNESFTISTHGFDDAVNITQKIKEMVLFSNFKQGLINIFVASSTACLVITEEEPGIVDDIKKLISFMIPVNRVYQHDAMWHEGNGFSYLRAALFQKNISIPFENGNISLDKYQQIILFDFDNKSSSKKICVTLIGE